MITIPTESACRLALPALLAVASLGHVQGLRAVLAVLAGTCAFGALPSPLLRPVVIAWLAWLLLGFASITWSVVPEASLKSALYGLLLPFVVFLGAARTVASKAALDAVALGLLAGLVALAALSAYAHLTGKAALLMTPADATGILRFHPGVGVATTFAALAYPVWLMQWQAGGRWRLFSVVAIGCILWIGAAAPNRMLWITLLGTTLAYLLAARRSFAPEHRGGLAFAVLLAVAVSSAFFVLSLHQRAQSISAGWMHLERAVTSESRFLGWQAWIEQSAKNPSLGVGYGKSAVNAAYQASLPQEVAEKDRAMTDHAHNMLLNIQLQLGVVGLLTFLVLLAALSRLYVIARDYPATDAAGRAGIALLAALLLKNATDDFMSHAIVIMFWALAGAFAGFAARYEGRPGTDGSPSGRESPSARD